MRRHIRRMMKVSVPISLCLVFLVVISSQVIAQNEGAATVTVDSSAETIVLSGTEKNRLGDWETSIVRACAGHWLYRMYFCQSTGNRTSSLRPTPQSGMMVAILTTFALWLQSNPPPFAVNFRLIPILATLKSTTWP